MQRNRVVDIDQVVINVEDMDEGKYIGKSWQCSDSDPKRVKSKPNDFNNRQSE